MKNDTVYLTKKDFLHMVIPVLFGLLFYVFFHKPNLLLHAYIAKFIAVPNYYDYIKDNTFFIFLLHHLPDACWIYSLGIFLLFFFSFIKNKVLKAALIIVLGSFTEVVQVFFNQFTFDWIDLIINVAILLLICVRYEIKKTA